MVIPINDSMTRAAALFGALLLFLCGFGWYLSMGLWNFPTREGFQHLAEDDDFQAVYAMEPGPYTLTFDFTDPKRLEGETLYRSSLGSILVTRVDNITDTSCRIWFRADGSLGRSGGCLVSACLPQLEKNSGSTLLSALLAEPQEVYTAYFSNYDGNLREHGNHFAVTIFRAQTADDAPTEVSLVFNELHRVTFEKA